MEYIKEEVYNKGSYWFKRLVDEYSKLGVFFKEHSRYPFCSLYMKSGMYNLHILSVPIDLKEINHLDRIVCDQLENQSRYEELTNNGKIDDVLNKESIVRGYWATVHKINKRIYNTRNNQEYLRELESLAKNRALRF